MVYFFGSNYLIAFPFAGVVSETIEILNVHFQNDWISFKNAISFIKY